MKKITFYITICFFIVILSYSPVAAYNLAEAVDRGLEANLNIKAQELGIKEAEQGKLQAYGNFLPTMSIMYQDTNLENDQDTTVLNNDYLSQNRVTERMSLSQPIFTGFYGISSVAKAKYMLKYQKAELVNNKGRLAYDIRRQFIQYLKMQDDAVRIEASVERLKKQLAASQAFYERQMAPKLHVMQAEVALARARQNLDQVKTGQENARITLNQLLALDIQQPVKYSGTLAEMDYNLQETLAEYLQNAKVRPDVEEARLNIKISEMEKVRIRSQNLPKINFDASYNRSDTEYDNPGYPDEDTAYWSTMLTVSMQLFHGGQTIASSMQQETKTKRYRENLRELLSKIEMDVSNSYASLLEARQRIDSATSIKEAATRSYERAEQRYKTGLGTSVDVLNALNDVSQGEADIVQARADFQTIKAELDYVTGMIPNSVRRNQKTETQF
jgi:outer membrane protein